MNQEDNLPYLKLRSFINSEAKPNNKTMDVRLIDDSDEDSVV